MMRALGDGVYDAGGMVVVKNADALAREDEERAKQDALARQSQPAVLGLSAYVDRCWQAAKMARIPVTDRMLRALRMRKGLYEPDKLAEIQAQGPGSIIYMRLVDEKCGAAASWLEDILLPPDDHPWGIKPSPVPTLAPGEVWLIGRQVMAQLQQEISSGAIQDMQTAQLRVREILSEIQDAKIEEAKKQEAYIERRLDDALTEAEWRDALRDSLDDFVTYPAAFIKGPSVRRKRVLEWGQDGVPTVAERLQEIWYSPSPFDIYPAPGSRDIGDGYLIERHILTRRALTEMIGVPGYDDDAIRMVLDEYGRGGLREWLWEDQGMVREQLQGRMYPEEDPEGRIEALQFWGSVQGLMLLEWGLDVDQVPDPFGEYDVELWKVGRYVIRCQLNPDPLGRPPYFKASLRDRKGAFWGDAIPDIIVDSQDMVNATARNIVNNMAIASGPQVLVDNSALAEGQSLTDMYPWKIWQMDGSQIPSTRQPIMFFQPSAITAELLRVYEHFSEEADNKTGIPRYAYGQSQNGGPVDTASGYSMMMTNASRGVKKMASNVDNGLIEPSVRREYEFIMLYRPDPGYSGDIALVAKGSTGMAQREQQAARRNEFLQIVLSSQLVQNLIGPQGIAEILRAHVRGLNIDADDVVPTSEQIQHQQEMAQAAQLQQARALEMAAAQRALPPGRGHGAVPQPAKGKALAPDGAVAGGGEANQFQQVANP